MVKTRTEFIKLGPATITDWGVEPHLRITGGSLTGIVVLAYGRRNVENECQGPKGPFPRRRTRRGKRKTGIRGRRRSREAHNLAPVPLTPAPPTSSRGPAVLTRRGKKALRRAIFRTTSLRGLAELRARVLLKRPTRHNHAIPTACAYCASYKKRVSAWELGYRKVIERQRRANCESCPGLETVLSQIAWEERQVAPLEEVLVPRSAARAELGAETRPLAPRGVQGRPPAEVPSPSRPVRPQDRGRQGHRVSWRCIAPRTECGIVGESPGGNEAYRACPACGGPLQIVGERLGARKHRGNLRRGQRRT